MGAWPERRNGDPTAVLDLLVRVVNQQSQILETIDSKLTSLVSHLQSGFKLEENGRPYSLRSGLDDASAIDTRTLLWIRDALMTIDAEMGRKHELMGQIRNGTYDSEQPAAPRTKRNADGTIVRQARG